MKRNYSQLLLIVAAMLFLGCNHASSDDETAFEFRGIYLPEALGDGARRLGLNTLDDWGIWGHNLTKVLPANPSRTVFATIEGRSTTEQFCFSSDQLYKYIEDYIVDNFGENRAKRFSIMPLDNTISCLCQQCVAKGCTTNDASPAVFAMIERLARRFPSHYFFTSYYLTTRSLPRTPLPSNAGVLYSSIRYDLCANATPREEETTDFLRQWAEKTSLIYVWDYIDNFDDYFTPFPVFSIMQRRLRLYREAGVRGVFLNGSGEDYSTFSQLRTRVLAALMRDPDSDWEQVLKQESAELFPIAGTVISDFMISQEKFVVDKGLKLPLYEGVPVALKSYLDKEAFVRFYDELARLLPRTQGDEKCEVQKMYQAMALTRLEIMRIEGEPDGCQPLLSQLEQLSDNNVRTYSETYWNVGSYSSEYKSMMNDYQASKGSNRLHGLKLTALTKLDDDYQDLSILTDGLAGLPSNYHCGHLISTANPHLRIAIPPQPGAKRLRVGLTSNPQFHIGLPSRVYLNSGGREIASAKPTVTTGLPQRVVVDLDIPSGTDGSIILTVVRNPDEKSMAIDEIQVFR